MPRGELELVRKKGRLNWYIRGTINGVRYDQSAKTDDREKALIRKNRLENSILTGIRDQEQKSFLFCAEEYKRWRNPKPYDVKRIDDIACLISDMPISDVTQNTLVDVAYYLFAGRQNATLNRSVLRPISAIVHYAAENDWCPYKRFKGWKEPRPVNRVVSEKDARTILKWALKEKDRPELKHALFLWFMKHGTRLQETLDVQGENINLKEKTFSLWRGKTQTFDTFDLDDEVMAALKRVYKDGLPSGKVFPWRDRQPIYRALERIADRSGVKAMPHMFRHTVGTQFKNLGAPIKVIMNKLGHKSYQSSLRYQADDVESVRAYSKKMKKLGGIGNTSATKSK